MVETRPQCISHLVSHYFVNPDCYIRFYKKKGSDFLAWEQAKHAEEYLIFESNLAPELAIDEAALSGGALKTFVTNKIGKARQGSLVAVIKGTKTTNILEVLEKIPLDQRVLVKAVTLDFANNMQAAAKQAFPCAALVIDRFHVAKLINDALQRLRTDIRWAAMEAENEAHQKARAGGERYRAKLLPNDETLAQLLVRSRFALAKNPGDWDECQAERAELLFDRFPELKAQYHHALEARSIYNETQRIHAESRFKAWIEKTQTLGSKRFSTVANTLALNLENILNFFDKRYTNASAESFNAKVKLFRANVRGVKDSKFFLYRIAKLFG